MRTRNLKRKQRRVLIGSVLSILLIGSLQTDTSLAADRPDFSGNWQLNEELSENPREKMMEKMRGSGGGSRGRGGAGGMRSGGSQEDMRSRYQSMAERVQELEILHQEPELVIEFADGSSRTIFTDGQVVTDDFAGGVLEGKGKWKGDSQVVFKSESAVGSKVTEIYELNETGDMLFLTTKMEGDGRRPSISFRRVYDRS
jgi:hypothetical protein